MNVRYSAAPSRELSDTGVRRLIASYTGRHAAVVPNFTMQPGMLYTQVRAISARINQNYDAWPSEELKKSFRTFLGKPVFVNHENFDPSRARGRVVAARYRENGDDKYIEVIQEIDALRFPKLAREIHEGGLDSVSMGAEAGFTKCSICDNKATDITDMCDHVKHHKGETLRHAKTGEPTLCFEHCFKLGFFELSYVFDPADETAVVSRVVVANKKQATDAPWVIVPTPEELAQSAEKSPRKRRRIFDPDQILDDLEDDRKIKDLKTKLRRYPQDQFLVAGIATDVDWTDVGRRAYASGDPANIDRHPDLGPLLAGLSADAADFARGRYEQGYTMARQARRRHAVGEIPTAMTTPGQDEDDPTMSGLDLSSTDMTQMPSAPTDYGNIQGPTPGSGFGGSSSGGSSSGGGSSSSGGDPGGVGANGIMDVSRPLYDALMQKFPGTDIGGYRVDGYQEHDHGALDVMTTDADVAAQARQMGFDAGAPHAIWQQQMWYPDGRVESMPDRGSPTQNHMDHVHIGPLASRQASHRYAWGETEAPEDIDTLRDQSEDDGSDDFHHYVESPKELRTPDFSQTQRLDRAQEQMGLDADRRVEDIEAVGIPTRQGGTMPRYAEQAPMDPSMMDPAMMGGGDPGGGQPAMDPSLGQMSPEEELALLNQAQGDLEYAEAELYGAPQGDPGMDPGMDPAALGGDPGADPLAGIDPAALAAMMGGGGGDPSMDPSMAMDPGAAAPIPPQIQARRIEKAYLQFCAKKNLNPTDRRNMDRFAAALRPVQNAAPQQKVRKAQKGRSMGINLSERGKVASRGAHRRDAGNLDVPPKEFKRRGDGGKGDFGGSHAEQAEDDWGHYYDVTRVDGKRADGEGYHREWRDPQGDVRISDEPLESDYEGRHRRSNRRFVADDGYVDGGPYGRNDQGEQEDVFLSQTPGEEAVATPEAGDSISNTENTLVARVQRGTAQLKRDAAALAYLRRQRDASRRHAGDNIEEATTVNPDLSGTDDQSLKGDDFDSVALDNVSTQPKDASIHAFAAFDDWLARSTGKTARQHGNANFIRRQAARYIRSTGVPLEHLFPTLERVLVAARKAEGTNRKASTMKRTADEKLDVAAPGDRIDVEAPVKNVTDAEAQASQYEIGDYGNNASDNLADPDLSTDSQFWAPGEGNKTSSQKTADAVAAVRCAEAYITAGLAPADDKWKLIARFQTMRHATVVDRTRLLEAKNEVDRSRFAAHQRSAAVSRGATNSIPPGLGSGQRTAAQSQRIAANDPTSDSLLFFK